VAQLPVDRLGGTEANSSSVEGLDALEREVREYEVGGLKAWLSDKKLS
jgi:hypothetical protein